MTVDSGAGTLQPVWRPSRRIIVGLGLGSVVLALVAVYAGLVIAFADREPGPLRIAPVDLLATVAVLAAALVAHELVRAMFIAAYGGRPRLSLTAGGPVPRLSCTAPGQRFPRLGYTMVNLAPTLFVSLALLVGLRSGVGAWFVIPFGIHLGGCAADWLAAGVALRAPSGCLVEDVAGGIALRDPSAL